MKKFPIVVVLEDIRSALNVGAIFRTCDGAGVSKLYLAGITPYPPHNRIPKTALGAVEFVEWERHADPLASLESLKADGYTIYAVEQSANSIPYSAPKYQGKLAFVFGNEISGVSSAAMKIAYQVIELPMFGQKNSLNVATTVGIVTYHAALQLNS